MSPRKGWAVAAVLATFIVLGAIDVFYIGYAIDRNNKRTCSLYALTYESIDVTKLNRSNPQQAQSIKFKLELGKLMKLYECDIPK